MLAHPEPIVPSPDQADALRAFDTFLADPGARVFVLSGPAGTGKTALTRNFVERVQLGGQRTQLAALTGRAATIIRERTGRGASTLHSFLYRFDSRRSKVVDGLPRLVFSIKDPTENPVSILVVDEVSMLGAARQAEHGTMQFGSGNLAIDMLQHLFGRPVGPESLPKLVLAGDPYQLPPVGESESVAFDPLAWDALTFEALGQACPTTRSALTTVHRQRDGGVLDLATRYRDALESEDYRATPLPPKDDPEVTVDGSGTGASAVRAAELAHDPESQVVVVHTNAGALSWNRHVRRARWDNPDVHVQVGDLLVNTRRDVRTAFENGDILVVESVDDTVRVVSHLGRDVHLRPAAIRVAGGESIQEVLLLDNALESEDRTVNRDDLQVLWVDFRNRHRGLRESTPEFWDAAFRDETLNPIVAKYGYALTCHKAQGGQWSRVLVDFGTARMAPDSEEAFRWTYTAITRARERLVLIDPPRRTPFTRLAAKPVTETVSTDATRALSMAPDAVRARAEQGVENWAQSANLQITVLRRTDYSTRFRVDQELRTAAFDVFFKGDGRPTNVLATGTDTATRDLLPPILLLEIAAFAVVSRPVDPKVDRALGDVESALLAGGLTTTYLGEREWAVELEVGDLRTGGVLVLNYRKSGSFGGRHWRRKPDADVERRTTEILDRLANG